MGNFLGDSKIHRAKTLIAVEPLVLRFDASPGTIGLERVRKADMVTTDCVSVSIVSNSLDWKVLGLPNSIACTLRAGPLARSTA